MHMKVTSIFFGVFFRMEQLYEIIFIYLGNLQVQKNI